MRLSSRDSSVGIRPFHPDDVTGLFAAARESIDQLCQWMVWCPAAYDLDDSALQRDLGPVPRTPLVEGVRRTLEHFRRLHAEGRLDTADLDG